MKNSQRILTGAVLFAGVFALSAPAHADWRDRNQRGEYRENLRDLRGAQRELRRDLRRGAGREEIARDRAAIARERRELLQQRRSWDNRHSWSRSGRYRYDDDRDRRWNRWNRWNDHDRRDRGWTWGWRR